MRMLISIGNFQWDRDATYKRNANADRKRRDNSASTPRLSRAALTERTPHVSCGAYLIVVVFNGSGMSRVRKALTKFTSAEKTELWSYVQAPALAECVCVKLYVCAGGRRCAGGARERVSMYACTCARKDGGN